SCATPSARDSPAARPPACSASAALPDDTEDTTMFRLISLPASILAAAMLALAACAAPATVERGGGDTADPSASRPATEYVASEYSLYELGGEWRDHNGNER